MKWKEGAQFENPPVGSHLARCTGIIDLGTQVHNYQNQSKQSRDVRIIFELPNAKMTGVFNPEQKGKTFQVRLDVTASMHPKAKLRAYLEQWRGKQLTKEEIATFEPKKLLGKPCRITLIEKGEYVNISGLCPAGNEKLPAQINPSLYFSLEPDEYDPKVFQTLPEKLRMKIMESPEFRALNSDSQGDGGGVPVDDDEMPSGENVDPWA